MVEYRLWDGQRDEFYRGGVEAFSPTPMLLAMRHFVAQAVSLQEAEGQAYWYHLDGRGSVAGLTKHQGQSTHNYRYDAYGQVLPAQGNFTDPHNPYTFIGKEWDEHLGLYEFGVRLYDPWAGVWLTREPLPGQAWAPRTWHRYQYAYASPISYYDPYGRQTCGFNILTGERECFGERTGIGWTPTLAAPATSITVETLTGAMPPASMPSGAQCQPSTFTEWLTDYLTQPATWYDLHRALLQGSIRYRAPEIFNLLKLPWVNARMVTRPHTGTVIYGLRPGSWSVTDPRILARTAPSTLPIIGDIIGGLIVVGQDVYKYTLGEKQGAPFHEFMAEVTIDVTGYAVANVAGEIAGAAGVAGCSVIGVSETGVGAVLCYAGANFAATTLVSGAWDIGLKPWAFPRVSSFYESVFTSMQRGGSSLPQEEWIDLEYFGL